MNEKVIYTSLVGGYDDLLQPEVIFHDFDYICFSNDFQEKRNGVWEIRPIPFYCEDKTRLSRYVKLNPHLVLSEYKYSLWVDSNIQILNDYLLERLNLMIEDEVKIAMVEHPKINCIYKDAYNCIKAANEKYSTIIEQVMFLCSEGYPKENGLYENNLIFREHNAPDIVQISTEWWRIYMRYSRRDQLSFCYVVWKYKAFVSSLLPHGCSTFDKQYFHRRGHKISTCQRVVRKLKYYKNMLFLSVYGFPIKVGVKR